MTATFQPMESSRRSHLLARVTRMTVRPVSVALPSNRLGVTASRQIGGASVLAAAVLVTADARGGTSCAATSTMSLARVVCTERFGPDLDAQKG